MVIKLGGGGVGDENSTDKISLIYYTVTNSLFWALLASVKKSFFQKHVCREFLYCQIAHCTQGANLKPATHVQWSER